MRPCRARFLQCVFVHHWDNLCLSLTFCVIVTLFEMDDSFCFVVSTQGFEVLDTDFPVSPVVPDLCAASSAAPDVSPQP